MIQDSHANVIREMIRHEDGLLIARTNWLMTLQGLFFAALAFGWNTRWLPLIIIGLGVLFAILFIPYLTLSERAIVKILNWWKENGSGYDGPPIIGLEFKDVPILYSKLLPWSWLPGVFVIAWLLVLTAWLTK
jgi:fatty acid desaturase